MILKSTVNKNIPTVKGDISTNIYAQLIDPKVDNIKKEISFEIAYFFKETYTQIEAKEAVLIKDKSGNDYQIDEGQEKVTKERKVILYHFQETYHEKQVEDLYVHVKPAMGNIKAFFTQINRAIELAFEQKIKEGDYFGLKANEWEKLT